MFEEGVRRGLASADMTLEGFYTTLPNDYYRVMGAGRADDVDMERLEALESEIKARFHAYNKSLTRVLKRAKSRTRIYLNQPALLLSDFKKYLSWG
jgi:hypothetical protein